MTDVYEVELPEVMSKLPEISPIQIERDFSNLRDDVFLCALGFEDRCTVIPHLIAEKSEYKCIEAIYFEYSTNLEDNDINRLPLMKALKKISGIETPMQCDTEEFTPSLRRMFTRFSQKEAYPKVTFDISSCSSKLLLTVIKILCEFNIQLRLVYSEANIYHPTRDEIEKTKNSSPNRFSLSRGVANVFISSEHPGCNLDVLPEAVIAFATFNPERTKAVISCMDENLLETPGDRVKWVIGVPHLPEDSWRTDYVTKINKIPNTIPSFKLSTFDYKDTLRQLYKIHRQRSSQYHLNISPLGSKMQSVGIALFHYIRPDVTVLFAPPEEYDASNYSEGCKATWIIDFGRLDKIRNMLDEIGILKIRDRKT